MANSYIQIAFVDIPNENDYLGIDESVSGFGLNEIFKTSRVSPGQTRIPPLLSTCKSFEWTVEGLSSETIVTLEYEDCYGVDQTYSDTFGNMGGIYSFCGKVGHMTSSHGTITVLGDCTESLIYTEHISENYKTALDADFNSGSLFTIVNVNGAEGSGLGTVTITANFPGAIFSVPELFPFVNIVIHNETVDPINSVSPGNLEFNVNTEISNASGKFIEINAETDSWSITNTLPSWLNVSDLSGEESQDVELVPVNYSELPVGAYHYSLIITIGADVFEVPITLNVSKNIRNPFQNGGLFFTKEDVSLGFTSDILNTYIQLEFEITVFKINTNVPTIYQRNYNFPLFKGKGDFYVGEIVHGLIDEIEHLKDYVPSFKSNYVKKQLKPAEVKISFKEKLYSNGSIVAVGEIETFKMIKGYRPFMSTGSLALLTVAQQEITRITPQSVVGISFVYVGKPRIIVKQNNVIIEDFEVDDTVDEIIYSYYRFINNLKPGDSIEIVIIKDLETRSQRFLVFKNGMENTFLFFENNHGLIEPYEFTGRRRFLSAIKHIASEKVKKTYSIDKKAYSENQQGLIINTGYLLKTDHKLILSIIRSTNVWCSMDNVEGNYFLIDATTTKLTNQDTDSSEEDFDIEFNILEDSDASIYPQ